MHDIITFQKLDIYSINTFIWLIFTLINVPHCNEYLTLTLYMSIPMLCKTDIIVISFENINLMSTPSTPINFIDVQLVNS